jgi:oligo-1,6-glucosidase
MILVLLNFRDRPATVDTGINISKAKLLIDNYPGRPENEQLRPYEAMIYEL